MVNSCNQKKWVVKIGSSLVTNNGLGLDLESIGVWVQQIIELRDQGCQVVLVSSGAVAEGVSRLGLKQRPAQVHMQQAAAAIGQMGLVRAYEVNFAEQAVSTAQVLLTHDDLADRTRYLNARSTLSSLLDLDVVPVVNENDTVATAELCLGDNDTLSALVANLINADTMVILTDQDGLMSADPTVDKDACLIQSGDANDDGLMLLAGAGGTLGRGGMKTKLAAAKRAARSGTDTVIANGRQPEVLTRILKGESIGTKLLANSEPITARKQWLANGIIAKGEIVVDEGAQRALIDLGKSLLAVGIKKVSGQFVRGDLVVCFNDQGFEIARGLVNYNSFETLQLAGSTSDAYLSMLGYKGDDEIIHRDNLVLA
jgi:glutamate 5-kinase